jgi:hypothetical protein
MPTDFDFVLNDGHSLGPWRFKLNKVPDISWLTAEQFSVVLNSEGRRIGDFDEQRDWSGGRGGERFSDDPTKYLDAREALTTLRGHLIPSLQWNISTGYRNANQSLPGSVTWQPLLASPATRYVSRSFVPAANYTLTKIWVWVRRRGNPPDLTITLNSDSSGDPGSALKTKTITTSDVTDSPSVLLDCSPSSGQAVVSGTTYHLIMNGGAGDAFNHWEVAVSTALTGSKSSPNGSTWTSEDYSLYYRTTDADVSGQRWWFFEYASNWYKVSNDSTALLYNWNETDDDWDVVSGHGLGQVTGRPVQANGILFFPQGDSVAIRTHDGTNWDSQTVASGQGCATGLEVGYDKTRNKTQIWRYNNALVSGGTTTGLAISVSAADATTTYTTNLVFRNSVLVRSTSNNINSIYWDTDRLWVGKANIVGFVLNEQFDEANFGVRKTPHASNGIAFTAWNNFIFFNLLNSVERVYSGQVDDVGGGWSGPGLPYLRDGVHSKFEVYGDWMFSAIDAGSTGTSSVMLFDSSMNQHEFMRAFATGRRVRDVAIQVVSGARNRLWIDCGGDSIFIELPLGKGNPLYDSGAKYMHETVFESSIYDMGTAARLPKFLKELTVVSKNLDAKGKYIDVDTQVDNQIGKTGINNWKTQEPFLISPEATTKIQESNIRRFVYRLRMHTDNQLIPPDVVGIAPNGFARSEMRKVFGVQCLLDGITANGRKIEAGQVTKWLEGISQSAMLVHMESTYGEMHDYEVLIAPPNRYPIRAEVQGKGGQTMVTFSMVAI